jgi:hypothetical protein
MLERYVANLKSHRCHFGNRLPWNDVWSLVKKHARIGFLALLVVLVEEMDSPTHLRRQLGASFHKDDSFLSDVWRVLSLRHFKSSVHVIL